MKGFWAAFEVTLVAINVFIAAGFVFLFGTKVQLESGAPLFQAQQLLKHCDACANSSDVLSYALQLGRLDFVSMSLTCLGGAIAVLGLSGFWMIRREAIHASITTCKKEAQKYIRSSQGEQLIAKHVRQYMEEIMERYGRPSGPTTQGIGLYDDIAQDIWDNESEGDHR